MSTPTTEQRRERAAKAAQTTRERKEADRLQWAAIKDDREKAVVVCRQIRDDPDAAGADRLEAIHLLMELVQP